MVFIDQLLAVFGDGYYLLIIRIVPVVSDQPNDVIIGDDCDDSVL